MIVDTVYGFLGSGKTTFIRRVLEAWGQQERLVVLVNEFGEVGIDGALLQGLGQEVVELPSGCICCSLQADFKRQLLEIAADLKPERVIIEPTGVASITQVEGILGHEVFADKISRIHKILVVDATTFFELYKANRNFVETQVEHASLVLLNKCDLAAEKQLALIQSALVAIKPELHVIRTQYGAVDWEEYHLTLAALADSQVPAAPPASFRLRREQAVTVHPGPHAERVVHLQTQAIGLGLESLGWELGEAVFRQECLTALFDVLLQQADLGEVVRAKGIFHTDQGWQLLEIASGVFSRQPVRPVPASKFVVIGRHLHREAIEATVHGCLQG